MTKRTAWALCVSLLCAGTQAAIADGSQQTTLTLEQGRKLALHALSNGDAQLALNVSRGLWEADPKNPQTYSIIASAYAHLGEHTAARRAAAKAYRYSDNKTLRLSAAQLAARAALAEERPTLTQVWLRRAVLNSNSHADEKRIASDYARVRALNPWSFRLNGSLKPSSNVNNGADSALQIIDGDPLVGSLSGNAQALSGWITDVDASVGYRLRSTETSRTSLGARVFVHRVMLSDGAKIQAPSTENYDFSSTYVETSLKQTRIVGARKNRLNYGLAVGTSIYAQNTSYHFARGSLGYRWKLAAQTHFSLNGSLERRHVPGKSIKDSSIYALSGALHHRLAGGNTLSFSLSLRDVKSDHIRTPYSSASLRASYAFAKQIGPAKISTGLTFGYSDYDIYLTGNRQAPGGRQDRSAYGDVTMVFPEHDYAGFAPTLRVRTGRKFSNVSRFDTREFSVSLGIQSKF